MKRIKTKFNKMLLALTMMFAITLSIIPTNVYAADAPFGTFSDTTITGKVGVDIGENTEYGFQQILIRLENATFVVNDRKELSKDLKTMINNLPDGLEVSVSGQMKPGNSDLGITITGIPLEKMNEPISVTILGKYTDSGNDITVKVNEKAKWEITSDKYDVTVNGGTGAGQFVKDETVSITANAPASGKKFKEWSVVSGNVSLANAKSETTTFTMPENNVEINATYENVVVPTPPTPTPTPPAPSGGGTVIKGTASINSSNSMNTMMNVSLLLLLGCVTKTIIGNKKKEIKK